LSPPHPLTLSCAQDFDTEIDGLKREILRAQAQNETFVNVKDRLEAEAKFIDETVAGIVAEREGISARMLMLKKSMASTLEEEVKVNAKTNIIASELNGIKSNVAVAVRERHMLEEGIHTNRHEQITASKATKNLAKQEKAFLSKLHEKEIDAADVNNEMARVKVDTLNTEAHNVQLRGTLDTCVLELREKDKLIEKYQLEIRQRNDEIEKKMYRVDRLNRKYEKMLDGVEDEESMGPLEASIKNIKKEIVKEDDEAETLQRLWLKDQTLLVQTASESDVITEKNNEYVACGRMRERSERKKDL
jgi:chromosome segregation ATPase